MLNAKDSRCDSVSPQVPGTSLLESNQNAQGRDVTSVTAAVDGLSSAIAGSDQHCDVKVDVHRKSSSASSEPAIVALEHPPEKPLRQSVAKSKVLPHFSPFWLYILYLSHSGSVICGR